MIQQPPMQQPVPGQMPQQPRRPRPMGQIPGVGGAMAPPNQPTLAPPTAAPAPVPAPSPTPNYASVTPINPGADLRSQQIAPTSTNRTALAQEHINSTLPEFRAKLRDATQGAAGQGRLGSGMYRTRLGDLNVAQEQMANDVLRQAREAQIGDDANARAELRGERSYQVGQEQNAFDRARQEIFDRDALTNSDFGRNVTRAQFGFSGSPSGMMLDASSGIGNRAANASAAAGANQANQQYLDILREMVRKQPVPAPAPTPTPVPIGTTRRF